MGIHPFSKDGESGEKSGIHPFSSDSRDCLNQKQRKPQPNNLPHIWDLVVADMRERDRIGTERYGTSLQPFNGRNALVDAYQEALDLVVYLRQKIYEETGK